MRLALAAAAAAALFPLPRCTAASGSSPPSRDELRLKSTKDLKAILKRKGATCKKCLEKDDVVDKVIETWHWVPKEASSPDGKLTMTKEMFIQNLQSSYARHLKEPKPSEGGHQLEGADGGAEGPGLSEEQLEEVWKEFSAKLSLGEVKTDEHGQMTYEVPSLTGGAGFWENWKMHIMVMGNVALLGCSQRLRRKTRELKKEKMEPGQETSEEADSKDKAE
mmetsp:Transcript_67985/g.198962  ORF Transcript_67985/g.198962 Transcript_67985/m.198962 type:complete len:221 (-) Transcript_67985:48-710(-)